MELSSVVAKLDKIIEKVQYCTKIANVQPDNLVTDYNSHLENIEGQVEQVTDNVGREKGDQPNTVGMVLELFSELSLVA